MPAFGLSRPSDHPLPHMCCQRQVRPRKRETVESRFVTCLRIATLLVAFRQADAERGAFLFHWCFGLQRSV